MALWQKNGGEPQALPREDYEADGTIWTDLENNPKALAVLGWTQAPPPPEPADGFQVVWAGQAWKQEPLPPPEPAVRTCSRYDLLYVRMTQAERIALRRQALTDDVVNDLHEAIQMVDLVELDDPLAVGGFAYLEAKGYIEKGRAADILQ